MKVSDVLREKGREIIAIEADASVVDAASKMMEMNIGALLVEDGKALAGLVTERDVMKVLAEKKEGLKDLEVREIMVRSDHLVVAEAVDEIEYVMTVMIQNNIRHLPIVEQGSLIGILSIRDVVKTHVRKLKAEIHYLKEYISAAG